jgi:hypothetical protein
MTPIEWLLSGDTGVSSKAICAVMTGSAKRDGFDPDTPHDPDDFGRCYRLLKCFPEWRERLPEVAAKHPKWGPMVAVWDELTALYEQCCEPDGRYTRRSYDANKEVAGRLYERMRKLNDEGMRADGWVEVSKGSWERADETELRLNPSMTIKFGK